MSYFTPRGNKMIYQIPAGSNPENNLPLLHIHPVHTHLQFLPDLETSVSMPSVEAHRPVIVLVEVVRQVGDMEEAVDIIFLEPYP